MTWGTGVPAEGTGDAVVVDVPNGHHIGYVSLQGELVRLQMMKKNVADDEVRAIYRIASQRDLEKFTTVQNRENTTQYKTREIIHELKLEMKLTDVEFQADNTKATFYYSADERVDFRELIKRLASRLPTYSPVTGSLRPLLMILSMLSGSRS